MGLRISGATADKFNILQRRAEQQAKAQTQEQKDALKRRFAALGAQASGEAIKAEQQAGEAGARRLQTAREGIEFAKLGEQERLDAESRAREFATSERLGSQEFGAGQSALARKFAETQAGLGREFQRGERLGAQEFGAGQAELQRGFLTGERLGAEEFQAGQSAAALKQQRVLAAAAARDAGNLQQKQLDFAAKESGLQRSFEQAMFDQEFAEQVRVTDHNIRMGIQAAGQGSPGLFDQLGFGNIGLSTDFSTGEGMMTALNPLAGMTTITPIRKTFGI